MKNNSLVASDGDRLAHTIYIFHKSSCWNSNCHLHNSGLLRTVICQQQQNVLAHLDIDNIGQLL